MHPIHYCYRCYVEICSVRTIHLLLQAIKILQNVMYSLKIEGTVSFSHTQAKCMCVCVCSFAPKKHSITKWKMHIYLFDLFDLMLVINKNQFAILHKKRKRGKSNLSNGNGWFYIVDVWCRCWWWWWWCGLFHVRCWWIGSWTFWWRSDCRSWWMIRFIMQRWMLIDMII